MSEGAALRCPYQIRFGLLLLGEVSLGVWLALLLGAGATSGALWWGMTVAVSAALAFTTRLLVARWRGASPVIELEGDTLRLPAGLVGQAQRAISLREVTRVRFVGRATLIRRRAEREAVYIISGQRYLLVMSELFVESECYQRFRVAFIDALRTANPEAQIDVDGEAHP